MIRTFEFAGPPRKTMGDKRSVEVNLEGGCHGDAECRR